MAKQIDQKVVDTTDPKKWTVEASTAGFAPGEWPLTIEVANKEAGEFRTFDMPRPLMQERTLVAFIYRNLWNNFHELHVLND